MNVTSLPLAIVTVLATLAAGVGGALATGWFSERQTDKQLSDRAEERAFLQKQEERKAAEARTAADRRELRVIVDSVSIGLDQAETALARVRAEWTNARSDADVVTPAGLQDRQALSRATEKIARAAARLEIRLGPSHPLARNATVLGIVLTDYQNCTYDYRKQVAALDDRLFDRVIDTKLAYQAAATAVVGANLPDTEAGQVERLDPPGLMCS